MLEFRKKLAEKKEASKGIAKAGFTLIELLVVLVILGILVLIAAPRFLGYSKDADVTAMQADAKVLANAALIYNVENEGWPGQVQFDESGDRTTDAVTVDKAVNTDDTVTGWVLSEDDFEDHVQSLKGDFDEYLLVAKTEEPSTIDGKELQEGEIVFIGNGGEGVKDKDGNTHYTVDIEVK